MEDWYVKEMAEKIMEGKCILFVGSGVSVGRGKEKGKGCPSAKGFSKELAKSLKESKGYSLPHNLDLMKTAQYYEMFRGREELVRKIKEKFWGKKPLIAHENIAKLPFKVIFTTNYDDLIEKSLESKCCPVKYGKFPQWDEDKVVLVKMHGSADDIDHGSADDIDIERIMERRLVISVDDYVDFIGKNSFVKDALKFYFKTKNSFLLAIASLTSTSLSYTKR